MQSKRRDFFTGLTSAAWMPAFAISSTENGPIDVRMIIGTPAMIGSDLIAAANMSPSMPGICMSVITKSYAARAVAHCRRASASFAFGMQVGMTPQEERWWCRMCRFVALSSTTSARKPARVLRFAVAVRASAGCLPSRTVNQKVDPLPGVLVTPMSPSIMEVNCLEIANPNPVPPYLRVVEPSAWLNALNKRACASSETPIPVSLTSKRTTTWASSSLSLETSTKTSP